jgi:transcriptional regulator with XRE-family HTH domain
MGKIKPKKLSLREFRYSIRLTQQEFADIIGYSRSMIAKAEESNTISEKFYFRIKENYPKFVELADIIISEV